MKNSLNKLFSLAASSVTIIGSSFVFSPAVHADSIDDFNNAWLGKAMDYQRALDNYAPIIDNNILGTHNTYNSEVYTSCNFSVGCRYLDPQQKYSIRDQLRMGARFIEIDVHWTTKMESLFSYPKRLLMCHGFCSINDKYATEGFNEIKDWLASAESQDEVLILYIEDATEGHHSDLYSQMNERFGDKIYPSNGCGDIPDTLTKADVLAAGKQIILWKDSGCSSDGNLSNLAFTGLGKVGRIWEDATTLGTIKEFFEGGIDSLSANEVREAFATGANIVNLDDMVMDDGRIEAAVWSWDNNEPNNSGGNQDCAVQWENGRWDDNACSASFAFACEDASGNWFVPDNTTGAWSEGVSACANLGGTFSMPTNSQSNQKLKLAKESVGYNHVWLNHTDAETEGQWLVQSKVTHFSALTSESLSFNAGGLVLKAGESIVTDDRLLSMQGDGNLVLYKYGNGQIGNALWSSGTNWGSDYKVSFQGDGNFVIYDANGSAKWASGTNPSGSKLALQGDGNLVIYSGTGQALWATGTN
ncbi:lectin-like protein [Marinomonas sp. S3726]|uniref:lectin-like protein n=1 Tax=Marinomonas sp. S3726 TaxID=579484 RepID=UPI000A80BE01|nr:lectin-like protein [Marinomonas sp. S3726]